MRTKHACSLSDVHRSRSVRELVLWILCRCHLTLWPHTHALADLAAQIINNNNNNDPQCHAIMDWGFGRVWPRFPSFWWNRAEQARACVMARCCVSSVAALALALFLGQLALAPPRFPHSRSSTFLPPTSLSVLIAYDFARADPALNTPHVHFVQEIRKSITCTLHCVS